MKYSGRLPTTNVNVTETSPLKELAILLGGLLAIVFIVYWLLGLGVDFAVQRLSPQQEKALSFSLTKEYFSMSHDDVKSAALQKIVDAMQSQCIHLPYAVKVFVVESKDVNAIALPGGTILMFSGLLEKVRSENELAFILGHELGHFKHKDHLRGFGRGIVLIVLYALLFGTDDSADGVLSSFISFSESSHSRDQEFAADAVALESVQCRYGHVTGATRFFEELLKEEEPKLLGHFLASHPDSNQRIRDITAQAREAGYPQGSLVPLGSEFKG